MSVQKVNHSVFQPWTGTDGSLETAGAGVLDADLKRSEWLDTNGWTDKLIAWNVESGGTVDFDINIHVSSQGYYELNAKTAASTLSTDDYKAIEIVNAHTGTVYASVDSDDIEALGKPIRSLRVEINNDQAQAVTGCQVWVEGWS
jgi:hypothetical protein